MIGWKYINAKDIMMTSKQLRKALGIESFSYCNNSLSVIMEIYK